MLNVLYFVCIMLGGLMKHNKRDVILKNERSEREKFFILRLRMGVKPIEIKNEFRKSCLSGTEHELCRWMKYYQEIT